MPIERTELRDTAVASIQRYFDQNMEEPIGNIAAGALLGFFLGGNRAGHLQPGGC